ncbi:hypothetical protein C8R43DRAFT_954817 [Mycena crocata]|nr:hypothetical protein C8R43DRAFT_954817 [Mycena crocata]
MSMVNSLPDYFGWGLNSIISIGGRYHPHVHIFGPRSIHSEKQLPFREVEVLLAPGTRLLLLAALRGILCSIGGQNMCRRSSESRRVPEISCQTNLTLAIWKYEPYDRSILNPAGALCTSVAVDRLWTGRHTGIPFDSGAGNTVVWVIHLRFAASSISRKLAFGPTPECLLMAPMLSIIRSNQIMMAAPVSAVFLPRSGWLRFGWLEVRVEVSEMLLKEGLSAKFKKWPEVMADQSAIVLRHRNRHSEASRERRTARLALILPNCGVALARQNVTALESDAFIAKDCCAF